MSCILLIPSILAVVQNPRVDNAVDGWNALIYDRPQRYLHILECFFFPPEIPAQPNFTPDSESKWASLGAWLPLFSMTGVIAFFSEKETLAESSAGTPVPVCHGSHSQQLVPNV